MSFKLYYKLLTNMKNEATKFFKEYFKVHEQDMEIYGDTIDCMVKFAEKVNNPDVSKMPLADVIRCPKCGGENEYSQGFKQNIQPVDGGDWRQVCFNICDRCGHAIDVWFWD